jgi:hypothetical protein
MLRHLGRFRIGLATVLDGGVKGESHRARRREEAATNISKTILVGVDWHIWLDRDLFRRPQVLSSRRMDIKHRDQRRRIRELEGDIVADSDQHRLLQRTKSRSDDDLFVSGIDCEIAQFHFTQRQSG